MPLQFFIKCEVIISYDFFLNDTASDYLCFPYMITKDTSILLKCIRNPLKTPSLTMLKKGLNLYLICLSAYIYWTNWG